MLNPSPEFLREQADRCDKAAKQAHYDGDYSHADTLRARAQGYRRQAREADAGITERSWV